MARERSPARDKAKKLWFESGGKISTKELAAAVGAPEHTIRKWKSLDKWQAELPPPPARKRGGQKGNRNAVGHGYGAPKGNTNAETHGAYSRVHLDGLSPEERAYIESLTVDTESAMLREFQLLMVKERDLTRKIKEYEQAPSDTLYTDRVIEMQVPRGNERLENSQKKLEEMLIERDNLAWETDATPHPSKTATNRLDKLDREIAALQDTVADKAREYEDKGALKTSMLTIMKSSPFDRAMKLEAEYSKLHGRLLKLINTMRAHGIDVKRLDLDERKHNLAKQRLSGEFSVDPDTGELDDTDTGEDIEL